MVGNSRAVMVGRGKERLKAREFRIWLWRRGSAVYDVTEVTCDGLPGRVHGFELRRHQGGKHANSSHGT
jgi:hypothetical protein